MAAQGKPRIRFEVTDVPDGDVTIHCEQGHDTFRLLLRVAVAGALVTRLAQCAQCGETQPLD